MQLDKPVLSLYDREKGKAFPSALPFLASLALSFHYTQLSQPSWNTGDAGAVGSSQSVRAGRNWLSSKFTFQMACEFFLSATGNAFWQEAMSAETHQERIWSQGAGWKCDCGGCCWSNELRRSWRTRTDQITSSS